MRTSGTKERLLEAGLAQISEKGFLGATTRAIAKRAGVTEVTLFRHFGSKERLFEEVLSAHTFLPRLQALLPELRGMSYSQALTTIGISVLETLEERKSLFKIMSTEVHLYPNKVQDAYEKFLREMVGTLAGHFRELQRSGQLRKFPPLTGARFFLSMLVSYFRTEVVMNNRRIARKEKEQTVRDFVDIFVNGTAARR